MTTSRLKSGANLPELARSTGSSTENRSRRVSLFRWAAFILVALIGLAIRLPHLGARPMHTDEAINAYVVGQILAGEPFHYDPIDRHGPALAALALPIAKMQGAKSFSDLTESELRLTSVLAGTITILLFGAATEMFGFTACLLAALLFAVAPLPVYYDRYFIHESLFCSATFGLIVVGWRALQRRSAGYAAVSGACAAFMFACKETAVIHIFALVVAAAALNIWRTPSDTLRRSSRLKQLLLGIAVFLALVVVLFTWFGKSWHSLLVLTQVGPDVLVRAAGQGHQHSFSYFAKLLVGGWSGGFVVSLACLGLVLACRRREALAGRFLGLYGLLIVSIYSLIPYKTPWLALNFWLPLAIFAALAVEAIARWASEHLGRRAAIPAVCVLLVASAVLIAHDTRERAFLKPADENNPYAYAHTSDDILQLPSEIEDEARKRGISNPRIAVIAADPWPLPWYLRRFKQVGFWQPGQRVADADFYITSTEAADQYPERLRGYQPDFFGSRPGVLILLWLPTTN